MILSVCVWGGSFSTVEKLNLKTRPDSAVHRVLRLSLLLVVFL